MGFNTSTGWTLLFRLDNSTGLSNNNTIWFNAGSTISSGYGKYSDFDNKSITYLGFVVL